MQSLPKTWKYTIGTVAAILLVGLVLPAKTSIPVEGATTSDWNHDTFWHEPWGASGVHKGIDIFAKKGIAVVAPTYGLVVYTGKLPLGGNVAVLLGPKWRVHYLAHLDELKLAAPALVGESDIVGTVGDSGNAAGKQPHLHYSIISLLPYPWLITTETQGWKKMFILNPHEQLFES